MDDRLDSLLAASRRGSLRAFGDFIRATNGELGGFCTRIVGPAEADDAVQEIYLALWRALPGFRGDCSARTFLFVIARRTARRLAERRRRWEALAASAGRYRLAGGLAGGLSEGLSGEVTKGADTALEVADALAQLDLDRRTALVLTAMLGFSYAEAAEICDCPVGTVRSRVARAREQLAAGFDRTRGGLTG